MAYRDQSSRVISSQDFVVVVVVDERLSFGGYERWVQSLRKANDANLFEVFVVAIRESLEEGCQACCHRPQECKLVAGASTSDEEIARQILQVLEALTTEGRTGFFLWLSYSFVNIAAINLNGSPWLPVAVMHGPYLSAFEWLPAVTEPCLVVPSHLLFVQSTDWLRLRHQRAGRESVCLIPHGVPLSVPQIEAGQEDVPSPHVITAATRLDFDTKRPLDYAFLAAALSRKRSDFELNIFGSGPARAAVETLSITEGVRAKVRFFGQRSRDDVLIAMQRSSVFVATSEAEAFGLSIAEAMSVGCPVVCWDIPGAVSELVTVDCGIRVKLGDYDAMANAVCDLLDDEPRRRHLGANGRAKIAAHYSEDAMLRKYAELFARLGSRLRPNTSWRPPEKLLTFPSQVVTPGIGTRMGLPESMLRHVRSLRRWIGL